MDLSPEDMMEVMSVFKMESQEQMETLRACLAVFQTNPNDGSQREEFHRTAHSLKGSARMLGIVPVEKICEKLEFGFKSIMEGRIELTPDLLRNVQDAIDDLGGMIKTLASEGELEDADAAAALEKLAQLS